MIPVAVDVDPRTVVEVLGAWSQAWGLPFDAKGGEAGGGQSEMSLRRRGSAAPSVGRTSR